jgi:hypothetical protein
MVKGEQSVPANNRFTVHRLPNALHSALRDVIP